MQPLINIVDVYEEYKLRIAAEESLYEFTKQAWPLIESEPFIDSWYLKALCEHLEALYKRQIKNLIINMPPRTGKTTILCVMFPAWVWVTKPSERFNFASHSSDLSIESSVRCRKVIESDWYQIRWGDRFQLVGYQNAKERYDNDKNGFRIATSIGSRLTGFGGSILVLDDPNNATESDIERKRVQEFISGSWSTRANNLETTCKIINQQRLHEMDATGYLKKNDIDKQWIWFMLPMEYEHYRKCRTVPLASSNNAKWEDPRKRDGEILDPIRFKPENLKRLKNELITEYRIASQLQLRPAPAEGGIFKKKWFKYWKHPNPPKLIQTVQSWDTAMEITDTACYSACTTWGLFNDDKNISHIILLSLYRERLEYPELRRRAQLLYHDYRDDGNNDIKPDDKHVPDMVLIENKSTGISLLQDLRRAGVPVFAYNPEKDKNTRAMLASAYVESGRVWVPARPPDYMVLRSFADQLVELASIFPNGESRDVIDTMSQVILRLVSAGWLRHPMNPEEEPEQAQLQHALY